MAPRRPAEYYDNDEAPSNKRPRIGDEGGNSLHLRGGSGAAPTTPVQPPSGAETPPAPASLRKEPVQSIQSQQPATPTNQTGPKPTSQSTPQPQSRVERVLAAARASTACTLITGQDENGQTTRENVMIIIKLQVHTCIVPFETRLGYSALIYLRRVGPNGRYDQNIGEIGGWRVSKPSRSQPAVDPRYFIQELLRTPLDRFRDKDIASWTELATALRVLYKQDGAPRAAVANLVRPTLENDGSDLLFIQMIRIQWKDDDGTLLQGNGFGRAALDMYYRLVTSRLLPAWYAVPTPATFLLCPGVPVGEGANKWLDMREPGESEDSNEYYDRVENTLASMYGRWGYQYYIQNGRVKLPDNVDTTLTVMGRTFNDPVAPDPSDRLRRVGNRTAQLGSQSSSPADSPLRRRRLEGGLAPSGDGDDGGGPSGEASAGGAAIATNTAQVTPTQNPATGSPSFHLDSPDDYISFD